ncbi:MAG: ABC transporter permease subunit [Chitinophagales bacterium]|nr:ABC transporter permease subunit [Chitinophagales bacterium]MCZ2393569.1 ABC transporter permease subunit [Chitinophagales bacterium]
MKKVVKYVAFDILRNKIVIAYMVFLFLFSMGLFIIEEVPEKSLLSLLTLNLILIPLISIMFSTIYIYNSSEFIELLAAQPIQRKSLWLSFFIGLASALSLAFFIGCGIPVLLFSANSVGIIMIITGWILSVIFVSVSMFISVYIKDKTKGIGVSLLTWLYFTLLFDGVVLFVLFQLLEYPLEKLIIGLSVMNPIDLVRIISLLNMDVSALMGATSAIFKQSFAGNMGSLFSFGVLILWMILPLYLSVRKFDKKDL